MRPILSLVQDGIVPSWPALGLACLFCLAESLPAQTEAVPSNSPLLVYRFRNNQWVPTLSHQPLSVTTNASASHGLESDSPSRPSPVTGIPSLPPTLAAGQSSAKTSAIPNLVKTVRSGPPKPFPSFKIQGVYYRTNNPSIIINGETLYEGGYAGQIRVITITRSNVVLEFDGEQKTFKF